MAHLEDLTRGSVVRLANQRITIIAVQWSGDSVILTYNDAFGNPQNQLLSREDEDQLELVTEAQPWSFTADGARLRLVSEALRIRLAHLFDPYLAIHTSTVEPLPHQITAVYGEMLPRQPLRFLLADDPGAGKTIMAGLLIKELLIRGDLSRCLIVAPGSLVEQWQDELDTRFALRFELLTNDRIESARTGNIFQELPLLIARLDKLACDEALQARLAQVDWDLIVCDEAHKMSATYFGREVKYTKRYHLGQHLSRHTRHFLLLSATPHNGKEADFQLFMALLDPDRFEGQYREGVHTSDTSDLMRRLVKEQLLTFSGHPLFPERLAYTVPYQLSEPENELYEAVTTYVREEFSRAEALGQEGRKGTVGFALTILQRRLASSPAAIHSSLKRRRERLERRLHEAQQASRPLAPADSLFDGEWDEWDDAPAEELEQLEEELVDQATAARTVEELRLEIATLQRLERQALVVRQGGHDRKWDELSRLLHDSEEMFDASGQRRKLVLFTEHRDTLDYLAMRIRGLLGKAEAVAIIHGGMGREKRHNTQEAFRQDPHIFILLATDAAGEGINLQRAHLMINYDLPWNPNRLEQRFGRIHRIGQQEVCHLWNLVAWETREGAVYHTLLRKLERERSALGGAVFDVLGKAMQGTLLRDLMLDAIRYGDSPEVRARLTQTIEQELETSRLRALVEERALAHDVMDVARVSAIRQEMERMQARRLQPHYIASFFKEAFADLGGSLRERETGRYEISHVPAALRSRERQSRRTAVQPRYTRVCFERERRQQQGKASADLLCPGHPLLDATVALLLERHRDLLRQGALLLDESDPGETLRALLYLEHTLEDGRGPISQRLQFVEVPLDDPDAPPRAAGPAPYLDYRPLDEAEQALLAPVLDAAPRDATLENRALAHAIQHLAPAHLREVRQFKLALIEKTRAAVQERLTKEIAHWDRRAEELRAAEQAGRPNARLNSAKARQRADDLSDRLTRRLAELDEEGRFIVRPPVALGGALVVPAGLLRRLQGARHAPPDLFARETKRVEEAAMAAVMAAERALGHTPRDVSREKVGYDIESLTPDGSLRLLEVKGRIRGATTFTVTRNEILTSLNQPDGWLLALVEVPPDEEFPEGDVHAQRERQAAYAAAPSCSLHYLRAPFDRELGWGEISGNFDWRSFWQRGTDPRTE